MPFLKFSGRVGAHEFSGFELSIVILFSKPFLSSVAKVSVHELSGFEFSIVNLLRGLSRVQRLPRVSIHDSSGLELSNLNLLGAHPEPVACERVRTSAKCAKLVARERVRFRGSEAPVELFSGSKAAHKRPCVERIRRSEAARQRLCGGNATPV